MTLLGHNGAGKSTLIGYLLGFYNRLDQHPFLPHYAEHIAPLDRREVGFAPEASWLEESASAMDYLLMMSGLRNKGMRGDANFDCAKLFERVGLHANPKAAIKTYSKGMKQRLLLAIALLGDPKTLVLDEPTSGLDPFGRIEIEELLSSLANKHNMILCTHSLELAQRIGNEIWILCEGRIALKKKFDSFDELKEQFFALRPTHID